MSAVVIAGDTSGTITLNAPAVAGTTTLTLPTTNGTIITTGSSGQSIPKAALPTGSVLQVVQATTGTQVTNNTINMVDTNLSASITPTSATSKIIVMFTHNGCQKTAGSSQSAVLINLVRNSTTIYNDAIYANGYTNSSSVFQSTSSLSYLDSPATTSATTYKTQFANNTNASSAIVQVDNRVSVMLLLEIAA
jgi:Sec7-like guanine-nucleotide exchange factor